LITPPIWGRGVIAVILIDTISAPIVSIGKFLENTVVVAETKKGWQREKRARS